MSDETVIVRMEFTTSVRYAKLVEMPRSEFEQIQRDLETLPARKQQELEESLFHKNIDVRQDWQDEDNIECTDFDLEDQPEVANG